MHDPERIRQAADTILGGFEDYHQRFRSTTRRARGRFEQRDWPGIRRDTVDRFSLHPQALELTLASLRGQLGEALGDREAWGRIKVAFAEAILGLDDFELAQTFFNSLTRRLFPHIGLDGAIDFLSADFPLPYRGWEMGAARTYAVHEVNAAVVRKILLDAGLRIPLADGDEVLAEVATRIQATIGSAYGGAIDGIDVLRPVFVRNKGSYVVARLRRGETVSPLLLPLIHEADGLHVDGVLLTEDEASIVFSFARWNFHVDAEMPRAVIGFLHSIMPRKRLSELTISVGYHKHGKTEFYADLLAQVAATEDRFVTAPGKRGLIMAVFTLPSFEFVFKVIKDVFPPSKHTSRREVLEKYREVTLHDRVGRLVDFQEFEDLAFDRRRFGDELLEELLEVAPRTVELDGDRVVVRHAWVGRRVYPLDLFVRERPLEEARAAVVDWGQAIKDLAAANIFAGDMLSKNFGVTRHGRVVFYDYDEMQPLVDCAFRRLPAARDEIDELAREPWFPVGDSDVFPEEMPRFLGLSTPLREAFEEHHSDLYSVEFWQDLQQRQHRGEVVDFFPYPRLRRSS